MNIDLIRAKIAQWIVAHIAATIHPVAVLSLCIETTELYNKKLEEQE